MVTMITYSANFSRGLIFAVFVGCNPTQTKLKVCLLVSSQPTNFINKILLEAIPRNLSASKISHYILIYIFLVYLYKFWAQEGAIDEIFNLQEIVVGL